MYKNVYIMPIDLGVRYEIILCIQDDIIHLHSTSFPLLYAYIYYICNLLSFSYLCA